MATTDTERKLTAILSADVVGYSRLMGADEGATIATLTAYRKIFVSHIESHHGRVVDAKGDAILAEFASVVDAVNGAVEIQRELAEKNADLSDDRRMDFRIGINVGDVVVQDDVIYGDGVNIAARVETLADPGGVCVSGRVYDQVENKLPFHYEYLGEKKVKNIARPVRAYRVLSTPGAAAHRVIGAQLAAVGHWRRTALVLAAGLVVIVGAVATGLYLSPTDAPRSAQEVAVNPEGHPSIAVLAFDNLSGDKEQDYFGDGLVESITTRLHNNSSLFVIARTSSFFYKGKQVNVKQIGEELGVRYVLEGSVQKSGNKLRITAQLIDAKSGKHLWAESYDRELKDLLTIQDEITREVVTALQVKLTGGEAVIHIVKQTNSAEALDLLWRGLKIHKRFNREANLNSRKYLKKALELDPNFTTPMLVLGWSHLHASRYGWAEDREASFRKAEELVQKVLRINPNERGAYALYSRILTRKGKYAEAIEAGRRSVELSNNASNVKAIFAWTLLFAGELEESIEQADAAMRMTPHPPIYYSWGGGMSNSLLERHKAGNAYFNTLLSRTRNGPMARTSWGMLIANHMALGQEAQARQEAGKMMEKYPNYSVKAFSKDIRKNPFKDFSFLDRFTERLRKAGLPE